MATMELLKKARGAKGAMALADTELKNRALMEMARPWRTARRTFWPPMSGPGGGPWDHLRGDAGPAGAESRAHRQHGPGMREVAALPDPVGAVLSRVERPNGLVIERPPSPMGSSPSSMRAVPTSPATPPLWR